MYCIIMQIPRQQYEKKYSKLITVVSSEGSTRKGGGWNLSVNLYCLNILPHTLPAKKKKKKCKEKRGRGREGGGKEEEDEVR